MFKIIFHPESQQIYQYYKAHKSGQFTNLYAPLMDYRFVTTALQGDLKKRNVMDLEELLPHDYFLAFGGDSVVAMSDVL